jgi:hypothetical protein
MGEGGVGTRQNAPTAPGLGREALARSGVLGFERPHRIGRCVESRHRRAVGCEHDRPVPRDSGPTGCRRTRGGAQYARGRGLRVGGTNHGWSRGCDRPEKFGRVSFVGHLLPRTRCGGRNPWLEMRVRGQKNEWRLWRIPLPVARLPRSLRGGTAYCPVPFDFGAGSCSVRMPTHPVSLGPRGAWPKF